MYQTALPQDHVRILEAQGPGAGALSDRALGVAMLAETRGEHEAAHELSAFAAIALRGRNGDVRPARYKELDRIHAVLHDTWR